MNDGHVRSQKKIHHNGRMIERLTKFRPSLAAECDVVLAPVKVVFVAYLVNLRGWNGPTVIACSLRCVGKVYGDINLVIARICSLYLNNGAPARILRRLRKEIS